MKTLKNNFIKVGHLLKVNQETKGFAENIFCEFDNHIRHTRSAHEIMLENGFQAASIKFIVTIDNQKP